MSKKEIAILVLLISLVGFGALVASVRGTMAITANEEFVASFGIEPIHDGTVQWVVDAHMMTLVDETCEAAKQFRLFPGDNYSLETIFKADVRRLDNAERIAKRHGFKVPDIVAKFRNHPAWPANAKYSEMPCWADGKK